MHTYIHTCTHARTHTYTHTHIRTYVRTYIHTHKHKHSIKCVYVFSIKYKFYMFSYYSGNKSRQDIKKSLQGKAFPQKKSFLYSKCFASSGNLGCSAARYQTGIHCFILAGYKPVSANVVALLKYLFVSRLPSAGCSECL